MEGKVVGDGVEAALCVPEARPNRKDCERQRFEPCFDGAAAEGKVAAKGRSSGGPERIKEAAAAAAAIDLAGREESPEGSSRRSAALGPVGEGRSGRALRSSAKAVGAVAALENKIRSVREGERSAEFEFVEAPDPVPWHLAVVVMKPGEKVDYCRWRDPFCAGSGRKPRPRVEEKNR